ncbi:hypothetical protein [Sulfobacillus thermosulfidooxidans]|uniref:hypothetical protein n=1 Tax=Sulfobacillus thermosulfidooxidans TaxID=28034 RepID=UPI0006B69444|nr:hypothetical protein [Sulfobacillus thermosulfidooxidans]
MTDDSMSWPWVIHTGVGVVAPTTLGPDAVEYREVPFPREGVSRTLWIGRQGSVWAWVWRHTPYQGVGYPTPKAAMYAACAVAAQTWDWRCAVAGAQS